MFKHVSLPTGIDLYITGNDKQVISQSLQDQGAHVHVSNGVIDTITMSHIQRASLVVIHASEMPIHDNVYIEIGIALGLKKCVYIISNTIFDNLKHKNVQYISSLTIVE